MKKTFVAPTIEAVEYTVAARLEGSNNFVDITTGGSHDNGSNTICTLPPNAGHKNTAGGSGIGSCK